MNRITVLGTIVIMALSFSLGTMQSRAAQSAGQATAFSGVIPFVTSNNRIGFFDQKTGQIYMYDDNISTCIFIGQLSQLGQPVQVSKNENTPAIQAPAQQNQVRTW
jgi:hypothetical protein